MREVIKQAGIATDAFKKDRKPFEILADQLQKEIKARFDGLDDRLMELKGRK